MDDSLLEKLRATDLAILNDVVQHDQNSTFFEITEWTVKRLSDKGVINPDGLWLFSGAGNDHGRSKPWSVVLKILERQEQDVPVSDLWYWKRELLLVQSGLMERLPGPVKAPRFYKVEETTDGAWIWQEHMKDDRSAPWALEDYAFVAHQ